MPKLRSNCEISFERNKVPSHENDWRNLKCILPREINPSEKAKYNYMIFWKSYTMKKGSLGPDGRTDEQEKQRGFLGQCNYSI